MLQRSKFSNAFYIAWKMQLAHRGKVLASGIGVAAGFFLTMAQVGMMMGWIDTATLPIQRANVDLWVVGPQSPAFDYGSSIPRQRLYQARSVPGVANAYPLIMTWTIWTRTDGRKVNIELIGLGEALVGGPEYIESGVLSSLKREKTVIVDSMYLDLLGVTQVGEQFEILGRQAKVGGISSGVRTFTASPFVFSSIEDAIFYDQRYRNDEITFVLVKCEEGAVVSSVAQELREKLPSVEVLTSSDFKRRSAEYWMIGTGIGFTVIVTAFLGLIIGGLVISQTLFGLLHDHRKHYATLLALGFELKQLGAIIFWQALLLWLLGLFIGSLLFIGSAHLSESSPVPLRMSFPVLAMLLCSQALAALGAGMGCLRKLRSIDPVSVFSA